MNKDKEKDFDIYKDKISMEDRIILLLCGIFSFPVGFVLYYFFSNKDKYKYHAQFAKEGAWTGFVLTILILISVLMFSLAKYYVF